MAEVVATFSNGGVMVCGMALVVIMSFDGGGVIGSFL